MKAASLSVGRVILFGCVLLAAGCGAVQPFSAARPVPATSSSSSAPAPGPISARVVRVVDGDTVHVATVGGRQLDVRVIGEDSPETKKPQTPVQCFGPEASAEAHRVLDGQQVTLVADPSQAVIDRYGRSLYYVRLSSGEDLSLHMVAGGWSRAYKLASGKAPQEWPQLVAAEQQAQAGKRGLWGPPCNGSR